MSDDIGHILSSWPYHSDEDINVRMITGRDGTRKIQMRIDMGIIQMEIDGHPAGTVVEGFESWLEYYKHEQETYDKRKVDDFFTLNSDDFQKLRHEGVQYYYRYLSLMKLEDYKRVVRDTERNLRLFSFVKKHASTEMDRWALDQFRPYVIMMNTRAKATISLRDSTKTGIEKALRYCNEGIDAILDFYREYDLAAEIENSLELSILKALKSEFVREKPQSLEDKLQAAIREERFEDAAVLRDMIRTEQQKQ